MLAAPSVVRAQEWREYEEIPGQFMVMTQSREAGAEIAAWARQFGLFVVGVGERSGTVLIRCPIGEESLFQSLMRVHPLARAAVRDRTGSPGTVPTEMPQPSGEPPFPFQMHNLWHLENTGQTITQSSFNAAQQTGTPGADLNMLSAWSITTGDPNVVVAVFDSGVDYDHPEFAGRLHPTGLSFVCGPGSAGPHTCCSGTPVVCNFGTEAADNDGHGTGCAGALGANANNGVPSTLDEEQFVGVDLECTIYPVRVSFDNVPSLGATLLGLEAIISIDSEGLRVISMSYDFGVDNPNDPLLIELRDALDDLKSMDTVVVVISTNKGSGAADTFAPSTWNNVITIGATDMHDDRMVVATQGTTHASGTGEALDFMAPGWGMYLPSCPSTRGCKPGYATKYPSGTSLAAPSAAGVVSLLFARAEELDITLTWDDVYDVLKEGAVPLGTGLPNTEFGWSRIDAYESLLALEDL